MTAFLVMGAAALGLAGPVKADSSGDNKGDTKSNSSDPGPISTAINDFGQSLCPKLVKPGSDLATAVSEMQGNTGLAPTLTGMVTGLAIQMECPGFMTSLANGDLSKLQLPATGHDSSGPLRLPGQ